MCWDLLVLSLSVCWLFFVCFGPRFVCGIDQHVPEHDSFYLPEAHLLCSSSGNLEIAKKPANISNFQGERGEVRKNKLGPEDQQPGLVAE